MVFTGASTLMDSQRNGRDAAGEIMEACPEGTEFGWALAFCSGRHDPAGILTGIKRELGSIPVFGGAACGIITNGLLDYSGYACGLAAFTDSVGQPESFSVSMDAEGEYAAGRKLAKEIADTASEADTVLIFFDQLKSAEPFGLFKGSSLLDGLYANPHMERLNILGAGLVGDFNFVPSFLFDGRGVAEHSAVALVLPACMKARTRIMHGCTPVSQFLEITRMEGPVVYELDGVRALDVFHEMLGSDEYTDPGAMIPFTTTLAKKSGQQWAPYEEQAYINSLVIDSCEEDGSVRLFETDLKEGASVQIMIRGNADMLESSRIGAEMIVNSDPAGSFALYIDCAGRTRDYSSSDREEGDLVRQVIGDSIPLLGFYSSTEIAPYENRSISLNWTGILSVFDHEGDGS